MKKCYVACITPFTLLNDIDYESFDQLVERLIEEKITGIVICGTTGESPTLHENEKVALLEHTIALVNSRCEIYFGIGSASTCESMRLLKMSEDLEFEGYLIVTPYYNQPTQYGLYEHLSTLATETKKNIILYNVPSRTGVSLSASTVIKLSIGYPNIIALKQASHDLEMVREILLHTENFEIYSGYDDYLYEGLQAGMEGIVSVTGHLVAADIIQMMKDFEEGKDITEKDLFLKKLSHLCFLESNPICIKYLLSERKECLNVLRLPLTAISYDSKNLLDQHFDNLFS